MKKFDRLYGQNWIAQMQDAYANGILCSPSTQRSLENYWLERNQRVCDTIMHIDWWRFGVRMGNVWHRRYNETERNGHINILIR